MQRLGSYVGHDELVEYAVSQRQENRDGAPLESVLIIDPTGVGWKDLMRQLSYGGCDNNLSSYDLTDKNPKGPKPSELVEHLIRTQGRHLHVWYHANTISERRQQLLVGSLRDGLTYKLDSDGDALWDEYSQEVEPIRIWLFATTREGLLPELIEQLEVIDLSSCWPLECLEARAQIQLSCKFKAFMGDAVRAHICATGFSPGAADLCGKVFEHHPHAIVTVDDVLRRSQGHHYGPFNRDAGMIETFSRFAAGGDGGITDADLVGGLDEEAMPVLLDHRDKLLWVRYVEQRKGPVKRYRLTPLGRKAKGFMLDR